MKKVATTIGECADMLSGGTPFKGEPKYWGGTIPWASAKDLKQFRLHDAEDHLTYEGAQNGTRIAPKGSILVLFRGMTLHNDLPICIAMQDMAFNQDLKALVAKPHVEPRYLAYWLLANKPYLRTLVDSASHGTGRIHSDIFRNVSLELPSLTEQRRIADILGMLDDKIELNRLMNETLEAMARALFQSWFIDFGPVHAKAAVRREHPNWTNAQVSRAALLNLEPALAELFSSRLNHEADGIVPEGWKRRRWGDIATLEYGKSLRDYRVRGGKYRVFGTNGAIGFHEVALCDSAGIVIGRKGAYRGVHYSPEPFFVIDTAFYLKAKGPLDLKWAYYELLRFDINGMDSGSAIPSTSRDDFYEIPVLVPPPQIQDAFGRIVGAWFAKMFASKTQSHALAVLRDTLLPKLMSGDVTGPGTRTEYQ